MSIDREKYPEPSAVVRRDVCSRPDQYAALFVQYEVALQDAERKLAEVEWQCKATSAALFCELEPEGETHSLDPGLICLACWNRLAGKLADAETRAERAVDILGEVVPGTRRPDGRDLLGVATAAASKWRVAHERVERVVADRRALAGRIRALKSPIDDGSGFRSWTEAAARLCEDEKGAAVTEPANTGERECEPEPPPPDSGRTVTRESFEAWHARECPNVAEKSSFPVCGAFNNSEPLQHGRHLWSRTRGGTRFGDKTCREVYEAERAEPGSGGADSSEAIEDYVARLGARNAALEAECERLREELRAAADAIDTAYCRTGRSKFWPVLHAARDRARKAAERKENA